MGDLFTGLFGGGESTDSTTTPDANAQALNLERRMQLEGLFDRKSYGEFANERPDIFSLDDKSMEIMNRATNPMNVMDPSDRLQSGAGLENFMSLDEYMKLGTAAGGSFMEQIAGPEIASSLAMQGQEGSGAYAEALAKGGASMALPFLQSIAGFGGAQAGLMNAASGQAQARTQQDMAAMGQYQGMFDMSQLPQQLKQQDFMRQQGVMTTGLTGLPFSPGANTQGGTNIAPLWNMFGSG